MLTAIRTLAQESGANRFILSNVIHALGSQVLFVLKRYGLSLVHRDVDGEVRRSICTEAVQLLLLAFQQMVVQQAARGPDEETKNETSEDQTARFLDVFFAILVALIQSNGLPNSSTGNVRSDTAIGQLCAKSIVQIAKTSAAAFKMSVVSMSVEERGTLETSMRAELSGYPATSWRQAGPTAPQKKGKINFKAFA